jgi:peptide/nickel transport system permease protein
VAIRQDPTAPGSSPIVQGSDGNLLLAPTDGEEVPPGIGPYRLAARRLRRNKLALIFGGIFLLIVVASFMAPLYANHIAHTGPNTNHITEVIRVNGKPTDVVSPTGIPIGPTWHSRFFFGADANGRDIAVRLLYGGRNSIEIGVLATFITITSATVVALLSGFYRGWPDSVLSRAMDLIWAYPALLLGIALGVNLALGGISIGPIHIKGNSNWIPAVVIGIVYVPYVARALRGQVLTLRQREYVDAARTLGAGDLRIMGGEILPNLWSTILVFASLQLAQSIVLEASLSFLGAGVQPPNASWGTMISEGIGLITAAPHLILVPGITLLLAVLGVNIFGDGLRAALDPRARITVRR